MQQCWNDNHNENVKLPTKLRRAAQFARPFSFYTRWCQGHLLENSKKSTEVGGLHHHFLLNCGVLRQSVETEHVTAALNGLC